MPIELAWYTPRGFLQDSSLLAVFQKNSDLGALQLTFLASLIAAAVIYCVHNAFIRSLSIACVIAVYFFSFYGLGERIRIWDFFHWRASAVICAIALLLGAALCAPWLARALLQLDRPKRYFAFGLIFLPTAYVIIAMLRNITGTDPNLQFALSPWPAVTVFGLAIAASCILTTYLGAGFGLSISQRFSQPALRLLTGAILAASIPCLWFIITGRLGLLPFQVDPRFLYLAGGSGVAFYLVSYFLPGRQRNERARLLKWGAALGLTPILVGQVWAFLDYRETRDRKAKVIIAALDTFYERETTYPDALDELVSQGDIGQIPKPTIGFSHLGAESEFTYQSLGTSYLLEFSATQWIQCAYNPPYEDLDEDDWESAEEMAEFAGGSWSCPSSPPELW